MKTNFSLSFVLFFIGFSIVSAQKLAEKEQIISGDESYKQKKYNEAQIHYEKALVENKKSLKANYNLGNSFYNQKKTKEAIKHYQIASKTTKNKAEKSSVYHNLGNAFMQQKEYEKAVESYKNSLKNNPLDNHTRYNFALAKKKLNEQENKKPAAQKEKEKKEKEKKEQEKQQEENKQNQEKENEKNKKDEKGKEKDGQEKNNSKEKKESKPQINPKLSEGILRAIERQEQQTHKRIIEEQQTTPNKINNKDW